MKLPTKRNIDKNLFGWKPQHIVNGRPWPRLPENIPSNVPLKEEYMMRSMDYLDTVQALPIFEKQADIIMQHKYTGIVDVGCRTGAVNDILHQRGYTDYSYFGFDTSPEPIAYAAQVWEEFPNINYKCTTWDDIDSIAVDFNTNCLIWSGVLLYRPDDHNVLFEQLHNYYSADGAIIQEPCKQQDPEKWHKDLTLNTIDTELYLYEAKYAAYKEYIVDCEIFSGRRKIVDITL